MSEREEAREMARAGEGLCPACGAPRPDLSTPCPECGAPPFGPAEPARPGTPATGLEALMQVRAGDVEPYTGLRYLSKLFRLMAVILLLMLLAEVVTGIYEHGSSAIPTLLGEASRLIVLAGLLWGAGDFAILLIDVGHDVRAARILLGRQATHHILEQQGRVDYRTPPTGVTTATAAERRDSSRAKRPPGEERR